MFKLEKRREVREHLRKVNAGLVVDPAAQFGTDASGNVLGDNGKPVADTAPGGYDPKKDQPKTKAEGTDENGNDNDGNENTPFDYTTLRTHEDLDGPKGLNERTKPEGWDDREKFKVADKQAWLDANRPAPVNGW